VQQLFYWGALNIFALWLAVMVVPGVSSHSVVDVVWAGVILAVVNGAVGPILRLVTCPIRLLTLGLFSLVVNVFLFVLAAWISQRVGLSLQVVGWLAAIEGAVVVSLVTWVGNVLGKPFVQSRKKD